MRFSHKLHKHLSSYYNPKKFQRKHVYKTIFPFAILRLCLHKLKEKKRLNWEPALPYIMNEVQKTHPEQG